MAFAESCYSARHPSISTESRHARHSGCSAIDAVEAHSQINSRCVFILIIPSHFSVSEPQIYALTCLRRVSELMSAWWARRYIGYWTPILPDLYPDNPVPLWIFCRPQEFLGLFDDIRARNFGPLRQIGRRHNAIGQWDLRFRITDWDNIAVLVLDPAVTGKSLFICRDSGTLTCPR